MIRLIRQLGDMTIQVEGDTPNEVIQQAAFWDDLPTRCPMCSAGVRLYYRQPQGYQYYGLICNGQTVHECNFGIKKEDHSLFYKADSWRKLGAPEQQYQPGQQYAHDNARQTSPRTSQEARGGSQSVDPDDLPWDNADGFPEQPHEPDPFDWGDFLAQCRGIGVSGRWVRAVVGGDPQRPITSLGDILPWLKAQPNRSIASLVSQAATLRDNSKPL